MIFALPINESRHKSIHIPPDRYFKAIRELLSFPLESHHKVSDEFRFFLTDKEPWEVLITLLFVCFFQLLF